MKKNFLILTAALMILLSSCNKDLNQVPLSSATTATFYKTPADFIQGMNAVYNGLRGPANGPGYPDRLMNLSEIRSDNIYGVSVSGRDWDPINDFATGIAPNIYVEEGWSADFSGVFRANTILDQLAKNGVNAGSAALVTRLQAEARFLRAFFYFDMVRYYGKLPIIDHPVDADEALKISRSSVSDVYTFIIADLQYAIANLPLNYTGVFPSYSAIDVGRATKYGAEGLLAEVYMARSGPTYSIEGPGLGLNEWSLALPLLQDIINSGSFVFNPNYANVFSYANQNPTVNKEAVFDIMYVGGQSPTLGATYVWTLAPQSFFNAYTNTALNGSLEIIPVSTNFMNSYETGDLRKAATVHTTGYTYLGTTETRPFFKKWLDTTKVASTTTRFDWAENFIAIRYTDILMLKAECILHGAPGTQGDVDAIVNQVRTRAGLTSRSNNTLAQLYDERRREFANEGLRWFDLQRSGNLLTIINAWIPAEDVQHKMVAATANSIIYPVPQTQLDAAPGLYTQNPGY